MKVHAKEAGYYARALLDILFMKEVKLGRCILRTPLNPTKQLLDQEQVHMPFGQSDVSSGFRWGFLYKKCVFLPLHIPFCSCVSDLYSVACLYKYNVFFSFSCRLCRPALYALTQRESNHQCFIN